MQSSSCLLWSFLYQIICYKDTDYHSKGLFLKEIVTFIQHVCIKLIQIDHDIYNIPKDFHFK